MARTVHEEITRLAVKVNELEAQRDIARAELRGLKEAASRMDLGCLCDLLNPCWNNRPDDIPGKHWAGGRACAPCSVRAALDSVSRRGL